MVEAPQFVARKLSKRFDQQILFQDISFSLHAGDKVALIARNGTGKTTLIRCLMGQESLDEGEVEWASDLRVGVVSQNPNLNDEDNVREALLDSSWPALQAIKNFDQAQLSNDPATLQKAYDLMEQRNAWDLQQEVLRIMSIFRLDSLTQKVGQLSGGQRRRIVLARALLEAPDLLILDEPTNHLDLDMIEWLEQYLKRARQTLLLVTHDRYFLESICDSILELEQGKLSRFSGSFSDYLSAKAAEAESNAQNLDAAKNLYRKELAWARKQPRARGTKSKARMEAVQQLGEHIQGQSQKKTLEIELNMQRLGKKILELTELSKSFDSICILKDFTHVFSRGDRMGLIGRNGTGKSTFLNLLTGDLTPDSGDVEWGETVKFAYYRQHYSALDPKQRVIDAVREVAEYLPLKKGKSISAAQLLEQFLFPPNVQHRYIETLSGGEQRRLYLLTLLMTNPNFLILDEPTNDLDLPTLQVLEDFLLDYPGCLLVVSHDRYLMDKVVEHLFIFHGNGQVEYSPVSYTAWWEQQQIEQKQERQRKQETAAKTAPIKKQPTKLSWKEERELEQLDTEMEKLETEKDALAHKLAQPEKLSPDDLTQLSQKFGELQTLLEDKEMRWLELEEKRESLTEMQK